MVGACVAPAIINAHAPPSQTDGRGTFSIATWNIQSGRNNGLESSSQVMVSMGVDIGFLQETKLTQGIYTRRFDEYNVFATKVTSVRQGGVALFWRESELFEVMEMQTFGSNVMCFQIVTESDRFFIVGSYIPPSSVAELEEVRKAVRECPKECTPWFIGDLNVDLESPPEDERGMDIAEQVDAMDVVCMSRQFCQRRRRCSQGRWTWRIRRQGRWISSHPDYFLCPSTDRCKFKKVSLRTPRHYTPYHRAIVAQVFAGSLRRLKRYQRRRTC
mmetsp:Transcript_4235/g.9583  ORF Transcript_4235/g.9583 Transcript_4235/m.9583 type:complete len:273 (+) Transcript_4235:12554-13372(+)